MSGTAVVTGASRGLGRGIARALGAEGWTVYITGRDESGLQQAAAEVGARGGKAVVAVCDHGNDAEVAALFARVRDEAGGLDLLVNNAAAVHQREIIREEPFWEKSLVLADMIQIGLRSNYVAAYYAAPLMIERDHALIANISFYGAVSYFHGPAYGAAKAGTDKMTYDMGVDLAPTKASVVSIWPGYILTDEIRAIPPDHFLPELVPLLPEFETPEFTGRVIAALARDPELKSLSGQTFIGAELGKKYGIVDEAGERRDWAEQLGRPVVYPVTGA